MHQKVNLKFYFILFHSFFPLFLSSDARSQIQKNRFNMRQGVLNENHLYDLFLQQMKMLTKSRFQTIFLSFGIIVNLFVLAQVGTFYVTYYLLYTNRTFTIC